MASPTAASNSSANVLRASRLHCADACDPAGSCKVEPERSDINTGSSNIGADRSLSSSSSSKKQSFRARRLPIDRGVTRFAGAVAVHARLVCASAQSGSFSGMLYKQGEGGALRSARWRARWCVLQGNTLFYNEIKESPSINAGEASFRSATNPPKSGLCINNNLPSQPPPEKVLKGSIELMRASVVRAVGNWLSFLYDVSTPSGATEEAEANRTAANASIHSDDRKRHPSIAKRVRGRLSSVSNFSDELGTVAVSSDPVRGVIDPPVIEIVTAARTWRLRAQSRNEASAWLEVLTYVVLGEDALISLIERTSSIMQRRKSELEERASVVAAHVTSQKASSTQGSHSHNIRTSHGSISVDISKEISKLTPHGKSRSSPGRMTGLVRSVRQRRKHLLQSRDENATEVLLAELPQETNVDSESHSSDCLSSSGSEEDVGDGGLQLDWLDDAHSATFAWEDSLPSVDSGHSQFAVTRALLLGISASVVESFAARAEREADLAMDVSSFSAGEMVVLLPSDSAALVEFKFDAPAGVMRVSTSASATSLDRSPSSSPSARSVAGGDACGVSFEFADAAPFVFSNIRSLSNVDTASYLDSLGSHTHPLALPSPGKSGALFYFSEDRRYILKTLPQAEVDFFQLRFLKPYSQHLQLNPHSLLCRFFGLHCVKLVEHAFHGSEPDYSGGLLHYASMNSAVNVAIMQNAFPPDVIVHERYDLKGSTVGRSAEQGGAVLKDLNLTRPIVLPNVTRDKILAALRKDAMFLRSHNVMDYSLLLGIHFVDRSVGGMSARYTEWAQDPSFPGYFSASGKEVFFFTVIDIFQQWNVKKKLERGLKTSVLMQSGPGLSAADPAMYCERFLAFMNTAIQPQFASTINSDVRI